MYEMDCWFYKNGKNKIPYKPFTGELKLYTNLAKLNHFVFPGSLSCGVLL